MSAKSPVFVLRIRLGNEAMASLDDVAAALRDIAAKLDMGHGGGNILDYNGNVVGTFDIK
jgi:hypothetical protein